MGAWRRPLIHSQKRLRMIVLHASASEGRLVFWAASRPGPSPRSPRRRAGGGTTSWRSPLPYDAGADRLSRALGEATGDDTIDPGAIETWVAWLPTSEGTPIASSPLVAEPPADGVKPT